MNPQELKLARRDFLHFGIAIGTGLLPRIVNPAVANELHAAVADSSKAEIVVGLDIGTSKICAAVGERLADGTLHLLGIGQAPSLGVTRYGIVDIEAAKACVGQALLNAQNTSAVMIRNVVLAVAGMKISPYSTGPTWERIFEWEEPCYIDRGDGQLRPITLADCERSHGCQIVAGAGRRIDNAIRCLEPLGVKINNLIFSPAVSASAVLTQWHIERGVLVMDIGEGSTDYAVYAGGLLAHSDGIGAGGEDIADEPASRLKSKFRFIRYRLEKHGVNMASLKAGVLLTGGCSLREGMGDAIQEVFGLQVKLASSWEKLGSPTHCIIGPQHSCAIGLLNWQPAERAVPVH